MKEPERKVSEEEWSRMLSALSSLCDSVVQLTEHVVHLTKSVGTYNELLANVSKSQIQVLDKLALIMPAVGTKNHKKAN